MSETISNPISDYIAQSWLVLLLAICFGLALTSVDVFWGPKIDANKEQATLELIPAVTLTDKEREEITAQELDISSTKLITSSSDGVQKELLAYTTKDSSGNILGWAVKGSGSGYADKIELLIGLSPEGDKIKGIMVLEQKETPGLGSNITRPDFVVQFNGKDTSTAIMAVKGDAGDQEIAAITGATISSRAVSDIASATMKDAAQGIRNMDSVSVEDAR